MNKTGIDWVKNPDDSQGYTWNPITGCLNGCDYCYARRLANTRLRERYLDNPNVAVPAHLEGKDLHSEDVQAQHEDPFYPRFWPERVGQPFNHTKPRGIFTCDMSDLFGIGIPEEWTRQVVDTIKVNPKHRFYLLTKQPQNLINYSPFPDNCYIGFSADTKKRMVDGYTHLVNIEAKVKYISFEPLLERMDVRSLSSVQWVIIGAQSKPTIMPKIEWVREIVSACDKAGIPVFLKNSLVPLTGPERLWQGFHSNINGHWQLRQEMPTKEVSPLNGSHTLLNLPEKKGT